VIHNTRKTPLERGRAILWVKVPSSSLLVGLVLIWFRKFTEGMESQVTVKYGRWYISILKDFTIVGGSLSETMQKIVRSDWP
jgi:hypothetical protein